MILAGIISDRVRLGVALMRTGHTLSSAAIKAAISEAELDFWREVDRRGTMPREIDTIRMKMN